MPPPTPSHTARLANKTDDWFRRANAALLSQLPCRAGCAHCCIGVFPITRLDVRLLQEGLARLPENERARIATRAAQQIAAIESAYPALKSSVSLDGSSDAQIDRIVDAFRDARCPALRDDEQCSLYAYRPLACRSMGIPAREHDIVNGACAVQTFLPIVRLPESLASEEDALARQESAELARLPEVAAQGEELLNPYGFLSSDAERKHGTAFDSDH